MTTLLHTHAVMCYHQETSKQRRGVSCMQWYRQGKEVPIFKTNHALYFI